MAEARKLQLISAHLRTLPERNLSTRRLEFPPLSPQQGLARQLSRLQAPKSLRLAIGGTATQDYEFHSRFAPAPAIEQSIYLQTE